MIKQLGFFNLDRRTLDLHEQSGIINSRLSCENCGLSRGCKSPNMPVGGKGRKGILFIAEAPGRTEDDLNEQLMGDAGNLLSEVLSRYGFALHEDGYKYNAINCRPPDNRKPTVKEINCCRPNVFDAIARLRPQKIVLMGDTALKSFLAHRSHDLGKIGRWVGWAIPDQLARAWVFPIYHPSYILRNGRNPALENLFERHVKQMVEWDRPFPDYGDERAKINIITHIQDARDFLKNVLETKPKNLFLDYETTGLKPHDLKRHRLLCVSFSTDCESATAFPMFDDPPFLDLMKRILTHPEIGKMAQNIRMEDTWTRNILGYPISPWVWDTMDTAHILDNRPGVTGEKFQVYTNFGTIGYDEEVRPYISATKEETDKYGANAVNRLAGYFDKHPENVLQYNGMDSMFGYRLWRHQKSQVIRGGFEGTRQFFLDGSIALIDSHENGIHIDRKHYEIQDKLLDRQFKWTHTQILKTDEAKMWLSRKGKPINPLADKQISELLFKMQKRRPTKMTASNLPSVDGEVLKEIGTKFTELVLEAKTINKVHSTSVLGFLTEAVRCNDLHLLRPFISLNIPQSYRSSSDSPNFQNCPRRDKRLGAIVRKGIVPRPGNFILEFDFKGIEVGIGACYHKDPNMIRYVSDPTTDMHRDTAMDLFFLPIDGMTKDIRYGAKNGMVFPQFYGSYYVSCARNIWRDTVLTQSLSDGVPLVEHLRRNGIKSYNDFERHVQDVERIMWGTRFRVYDQWREQMWDEYLNTGEIHLYTGFTCRGLMGRKEVSNYQIQGSAFHCLLWSFIRLNRFLKENKMRSYIIGQIHDSIVLDVVPEEFQELSTAAHKIMCRDLREAWPWIIVPISIDAERSEIDGNWFEMKKISLQEKIKDI